MTPRYILAPYVATPPDVVERMIALADVRPTDTVYDLGCGDGRIAIAAAVESGAHGIGVDIEAYWIEQARANAESAGVSHLLEFLQADAVGLDLRPARVIFVYLVHWSTQLLTDAIAEQCAAGTRVVSHSFPMDTVRGTCTETFVDASGVSRAIHLWVVPQRSALVDLATVGSS